MITVTRQAGDDPMAFEVIVGDAKGRSRHHVTMAARYAAGPHTPEQCVEAAFHFLLDREPKEAILASFDIDIIARYFPEFAREWPRYLARSSA
jgi:hypothetical protein